ncbi:MAG: REP-associated tyrosine transposase [Luteimonas sp.]
MAIYASPHSGRRSTGGQIHRVTFATDKRQRHFSEWDIASDACRVLTHASLWPRSRLLAWALMPDHWQGLVELHPRDQLGAFIGRLKGLSAHRLRKIHPHLGWIWARAYHDDLLRSEEDLVAAARHIATSAVREGIVQRVADYPYWDAVWVGRDRLRHRASARPRQQESTSELLAKPRVADEESTDAAAEGTSERIRFAAGVAQLQSA